MKIIISCSTHQILSKSNQIRPNIKLFNLGLVWLQHRSEGDLLQAYTRTLQLTCNESQWQVVHTESHLKHRPGRNNRCCNEPRGCDTEPATEQQGCQVSSGGKRRSERMDGVAMAPDWHLKSAIDHLDWEQLRGATAQQKIADRHTPESAHLSQQSQTSDSPRWQNHCSPAAVLGLRYSAE